LASLEKSAVTESKLKLFSVDNSALYCYYYYSLPVKTYFMFYFIYYYTRWQLDIQLYKQ